MNALLAWLAPLVALVLPPHCVACSVPSDERSPLCPRCAETLEVIGRHCLRCGLPIPGARDGPPVTCVACVRAPPAWDAARAPVVFGGAIAIAVRRWKLCAQPELGPTLARLMTPLLDELAPAIDVLVPVPLHPRRLREREFNQASQLARAARHRGHPPVIDALVRVVDTPPQSTLDATARRRNVRGAFAVEKWAELEGARVLLIDDVLTSGATASECARTLRRAGAARVDVLTLARTLP